MVLFLVAAGGPRYGIKMKKIKLNVSMDILSVPIFGVKRMAQCPDFYSFEGKSNVINVKNPRKFNISGIFK